MNGWKAHLEEITLPQARDLLASEGISPLFIGVDFRNCMIRVIIPETMQISNEDTLVRRFREATGVTLYFAGPPCYRFNLHLSGSFGPISVPSLSSGILDLDFQVVELEQLKRAYHYIADRIANADYVATFATGGVPALHFITEQEFTDLMERAQRTHRSYSDAAVHVLRTMQHRFHLFPSLTWEGQIPATPTSLYQQWLCSLPAKSRILIFDTTFSGNAINKIMKDTKSALSARQTAVVVELIGVHDKSRGHDFSIQNELVECVDGSSSSITVDIQQVERIITEDQNRLIGYDGIREGLGLRGHWNAAVIKIHRDQDIIQWIGTSNIAHEIGKFLVRNWGAKPLSSEVAQLSGPIGISVILHNAKEREESEIYQAWNNKLLSEEQYVQELTAIERRFEGARRRYADELNP